ncbi:hypothetical protein [Natronomonas sp. EA1]|uniref:hypothetical protein n=1 Tax=Natronomonas sp. EA1 TaxID=3421655 RepID=UPI003EC0F847
MSRDTHRTRTAYEQHRPAPAVHRSLTATLVVVSCVVLLTSSTLQFAAAATLVAVARR